MLTGWHGAVPMGQMCKGGIICLPCRCLAKEVEVFSTNVDDGLNPGIVGKQSLHF